MFGRIREKTERAATEANKPWHDLQRRLSCKWLVTKKGMGEN